jgi:hypothetical protein
VQVRSALANRDQERSAFTNGVPADFGDKSYCLATHVMPW